MEWEYTNIQMLPDLSSFWRTLLRQVSCDKKTCVNYKEGYCSLANPEKASGACLDFEDVMEFLRLKSDAIKGALS